MIKRGAPRKNPLYKKIPLNTKVQQWIKDWLDDQPESTIGLIEIALIEHYGLKPPDCEDK